MNTHILASRFIINVMKRINNCNLKNIKINKNKSRRNTLYNINNNNNNNNNDSSIIIEFDENYRIHA